MFEHRPETKPTLHSFDSSVRPAQHVQEQPAPPPVGAAASPIAQPKGTATAPPLDALLAVAGPWIEPIPSASAARPPQAPRNFGGGTPLSAELQSQFGTSLGADVSGVRLHHGESASRAAEAVDAEAFAHGQDIVFRSGAPKPDSPAGRMLLAHEVAHTVQQRAGGLSAGLATQPGDATETEADQAAAAMVRGESAAVHRGSAAPGIMRKTKGEAAAEQARMLVKNDDELRDHKQQIEKALNNILNGKEVAGNTNAARLRVAKVAALLGTGQKEQLLSDWVWLVEHIKAYVSLEYQEKKKAFFDSLQSKLGKENHDHPKSQAKSWMKHSAPSVMSLVYEVADNDITPEQLWAYANKEGLFLYVRNQLGLVKNQDPSEAQLQTVHTDQAVSGYGLLGLDHYKDEIADKNEPQLKKLLPNGYDDSKVLTETTKNENGSIVNSGVFPDLKMALQAMVAMLKRRRILFLKDAAANGYATPTTNELVYWTYVYFNIGEYGGKADLKKYAPKGKKTGDPTVRNLSSWYKKGVYPHADTLLESYEVAHDLKFM